MRGVTAAWRRIAMPSHIPSSRSVTTAVGSTASRHDRQSARGSLRQYPVGAGCHYSKRYVRRDGDPVAGGLKPREDHRKAVHVERVQEQAEGGAREQG